MHLRLERPSTAEFWELVVDGRTYTIVYGPMDRSEVETEFGVFMAPEEAELVAVEKMEAKKAEGFQEIRPVQEDDPEYGASFLQGWLDPEHEPNRWLRHSQENLRQTLNKLPRFRMYNDQMRMAWCLFALGRYEQAAALVEKLSVARSIGDQEGAWLTLFSLDCLALQSRLLAVRGRLDEADQVRKEMQEQNPFSLPPEAFLFEISRRLEVYQEQDLETGFLALSHDLPRLNTMLESGLEPKHTIQMLHDRALRLLRSKLEDLDEVSSGTES